ncbi:MAG: thiamine biosynthesis protein ThiS [Bacteroidetes bacterium]|nr:MAG: thiamine biosynthesis protein ThiS [Bacteroidota bacterium]RLD47544.1 MAG: thiamine biosynthesis protein ThiS [Bacteroidota bacterium]RLD71102.1 MAG: thiamine biosynthesis protein ThiS [Bacteroidota bacterium]RLD88263.1 MAG: thiamine biosynthesis protein ThiS [Bacteroidota bacterium]
MNITLNNRPETFEEDRLTISQILKLKKYSFRLLVVKINGKLIKKDQYNSVEVVDGDDVQILHMISGG